jgi:hypothetical protein|tara:strand:+ start:384 stop:599 length:216 start_codon:yes stop_codon:yes gene_type:complete
MNYKAIVMSIKKSCQVTIECNDRIMETEFKGYDGRYYDEQREEYTILETENTQAEIMIDEIDKQIKEMKEA